MEDGTEALAGAPAATPPPAPAAQTGTATPPAPIEPTATPSQGQIANVAAPAAPAAPARDAMPKREGLGGILDTIADMLSPRGTTTTIDDQGQRHTQAAPAQTNTQKFLSAGMEALKGAARGMATPAGPNQLGRATAAGIMGGFQDVDEAHDKQAASAQADFERKQQTRTNELNYQLGLRSLAEKELTLKAMGVKAGQDQIDFANKLTDRERLLGSFDIGPVANAGEIADKMSKLPNWQQELFRHEGIQAIPVYGADGQRTGLQLYLRKPDIDNQAATDGTQAMKFVPPSKPGEKPQLVPFTPAGATNGDVDKYNRVAFSSMADWQKTDYQASEADKNRAEAGKAPSEIALNKGKTAEAYAAAEKDRMQAKVLNEANDAATIQSNAADLVHGDADPSNLSKRSKSYDATLAAAKAISLQETGHPFDIAKAAADYKFATNTGTQNTLKYLNSLVGHDNAGGNLATLVDLSNKLKQTNFPALNNVEQWAKLESGNPQVAGYRMALTETADQFAKILQGGSGSATSDTKLKQGLELFDKGFSGKQMAEVASTARILLGNRKSEMVGDNRYLNRWQGGVQGQQQAAPQQQSQQPQQANQPDATFAGPPKVGEATAKGANGVIVYRSGAWRDVTTGSRVQ